MKFWYYLVIIFTVIVMLFLLAWGSQLITNTSTPSKLSPGDRVAVLSGKTLIQNNQPCQENKLGFIAFSGPDNKYNWFKASTWFFPTYRLIAVIYNDGKTEWVNENSIAKIPPMNNLCH